MVTYIIKDNSNNIYKIGKTKNISKRFSTLSTSNVNLSLEILIRGDEEKFLHLFYKDKKVKNEWFYLNKNDIDDLKEYCFNRLIEW